MKICFYLLCGLLTLACVRAESAQEALLRLQAAVEADEDNQELRLSLGQVYLQLAGDGEEALTDLAIEQFQAVLQLDATSSLALAYLGSAQTVKARDAIFYKKMSFLKAGESMMNEAVLAAPEDLHVRLVRAITAYRIPRVFGRRSQAVSDFEWLLLRLEQANDNLKLKKTILFHAGTLLLADKDKRCLALLEEAQAIEVAIFDEEELALNVKKAQKKFSS